MMTEDEFLEHYKPIKNHLDDNASWDGCMFETYGKELEFVKAYDGKHVWTLLEGDEGTYISSGFHFVNRMGYLITEVAFGLEEIEIKCETEEGDDDDA